MEEEKRQGPRKDLSLGGAEDRPGAVGVVTDQGLKFTTRANWLLTALLS